MALRTERQSARMSKNKNGGLDQYGAEPFEQQQFGTAGVERVNMLRRRWWASFGLLRVWIVQKGHKVIIAAHGNTLRALMKHLDNISEKDILELNIPTG